MLDIKQIDFDKMNNGLVPVIVQDNHTLQVLMLGYMNEEAMHQTLSSGLVTFFSRSKNRLWQKGETSGDFLRVVEMFQDCDKDTILIMANPAGNVCHTGTISCFNTQKTPPLSTIGALDKVIMDRINHPQEGSYTNKLINKGTKKIAQKVGEEGVEVVIAALNETDDEYLGEMTDLLFHALVLLHAKNLDLSHFADKIAERHKKKLKEV
ncbi:MAG: bifunctional phosphoribosyl-AMP cyclohydrolase/phosphoribosyl-ATP diphosphatase [Burkholderiales bacterium]|jgi:phosphoribosyl-ATP pyrophosphohydrolase/phosphoribosyl-AMP cyclohydrolase|nr:bifunctional phosphoribosyl-AMP cyclohydrolase/phosphoribosyl-ATP diphosphatase [Burkholderiales bacterium]